MQANRELHATQRLCASNAKPLISRSLLECLKLQDQLEQSCPIIALLKADTAAGSSSASFLAACISVAHSSPKNESYSYCAVFLHSNEIHAASYRSASKVCGQLGSDREARLIRSVSQVSPSGRSPLNDAQNFQQGGLKGYMRGLHCMHQRHIGKIP